MTEVYEAAFAAVRQSLGPLPLGELIAQLTKEALVELKRPFVLLKPEINREGDKWFVLYGKDLVTGVAAFGDTPEEAARNFDIAWLTERIIVDPARLSMARK